MCKPNFVAVDHPPGRLNGMASRCRYIHVLFIIGTLGARCNYALRILCKCIITANLITSGCGIASKAIMAVEVAVSV